MSYEEEWDPFADPADAVVEQVRVVGPAEEGSSEASRELRAGDFMELAVTEGDYEGSWVACQVLSVESAQDAHDEQRILIYIPKQPNIVEADVTIPDVPRSLLRTPLAPANPALLRKYYPVPRSAGLPKLAQEGGNSETQAQAQWYAGKPVIPQGSRKLRLLVLHGTSSNAKIMTQQISPLRMACKDHVDFIFTEGTIDASKIPGNPQYALMSQIFPGHMLYQFANYAPGNGSDYSDLEDVMETLQDFMSENAPIDGVLATGQGSNLATLLAAQAACGLGEPLSFVVHHGGTEPAWTWRFPNLFQEPLRIPSLHVTGLQDPFLHGNPCHAGLYANPEAEWHSGDHRPYPRDRDEAKALTERVLAFMQRAAGAAGGPAKPPEATEVAPSLLGA
jgi:hypothetical protein